MSSKRYPEEFKIEAAHQVVERGHSVAEVASRLPILLPKEQRATPRMM